MTKFIEYIKAVFSRHIDAIVGGKFLTHHHNLPL